jgi:selenocysteine lyase/cysteine desulfurase
MPPTSPAPLGAQRAAFAVPDDVAYFNTASLAPLLHRSVRAGEAALRRRAAPWSIGADDWFDDVERLRGLAATIFGGDAEGVALVPATSYGLAVAARNVTGPPGRGVLVLRDEFPSGIHTWRRRTADDGTALVVVDREPGQAWGEAVLAALDERIGVVSVPTVHWTDGARVDLPAVAARAREVGARLVVDASQTLGAVPLDVAALRPDAVVSVGYKWMLGPFGRGYLWVAEEHRDGVPLEENWITRAGARDFSALGDVDDGYAPGAQRYDQGARTMFELTPMAVAAAEQIVAWGVDRIAAGLAATTATIAGRLAAAGLEPTAPPADRSPHILGVPVPPDSRDRVAEALAGHGCHAGFRGPVLRISPHLHVTDADVDRLVTALAGALG